MSDHKCRLENFTPIDYTDDIKEFKQEIKEIKNLLMTIQLTTAKDITRLEVKSGIWGALGGLIPVIITIFTILLSMKL